MCFEECSLTKKEDVTRVEDWYLKRREREWAKGGGGILGTLFVCLIGTYVLPTFKVVSEREAMC